jgi:Flp pilus assembly protein TadD
MFRSTVLSSAVISLALIAGCSSQHKVTQREKALAQWNGARASVLAGLARDQYNNGNFEKCKQTLDEALKLNPKDARLHVLAAKLAIEQGQLELAERELQEASKLDPKNAEADYLSGAIYQRWQQPQKALEFYEMASDKAPAELAYILARAEMLVAMEKTDQALALLQEKVTYFEHSAVIRDAVGQLLIAQKHFPQAVDVLRQASILGNDDLTIREHLAIALFMNQQYREAGESISRLLGDEKYAKRGDLFLALGECQMQTGKPVEARASLETASELMPAAPEVWLSLAKSAIASNDLRRAELSLRRAVALDPASSEAQLLLGYVRLKQNKLDEAWKALQKASTTDSSDPLTYCMLGYVYQRTGQAAQAIASYKKALQLRPGDELATKLMASVDMSE